MKSLFSMILGVVFFMTHPCEATHHARNRKSSFKKTYVDPQTIKISKDGIFLFKNGLLFPIKGIFKDKNGIFIIKGRERCIYPCSHCGRPYDWNEHFLCPHCHHRH